MKNSNPAILWFRRDLRLGDNPALCAAAASGRPLIACFLLDETAPEWGWLGGAGKWWLHHSLGALQAALAERGLPLMLRRGPAADLLLEIAERTGAGRIHVNRLPEPSAAAADSALARRLRDAGLQLESCNAALLFEPPQPLNGAGDAYRVFTPFWRACRSRPEPAAPLAIPDSLAAAETGMIDSDRLQDWQLLPSAPDWAGGLRQAWRPGEAGARDRFAAFLDGPAAGYASGRDFPAAGRTSRLSPHLHWGEISPRTVWHALQSAAAAGQAGARDEERFLAELGWREFAHHLLHHFPSMPTHGLNGRFDAFPWTDPSRDREARRALRAWQQGRTGYPIVDAGMRELWASGWMHNRVRMIAASFLVKDLLIDWRAGAAWFRDTLVDADLANNSAGWQWVAGCGADAAPFFRVFNPVLQGRKFDPDGSYVRHWVPELAALSDDHLHAPWLAPTDILAQADIRLGKTYPVPIVDHAAARHRALAAFQSTKDAPEQTDRRKTAAR